MRRFISVAVVGGVSAMAAGVAAAPEQARLKIDFDEGQSMSNGKFPKIVNRSGKRFSPTIDRGTQAESAPAIVSSGCITPPKCLRISMDPTAPGSQKNKIMYNFWSHHHPVPGGAGGHIRLGDNRVTHVDFAMKLDQKYDTPLQGMLHFQIFQPKGDGKIPHVSGPLPGGPVISLNIVPKSHRVNKAKDIEEFIIIARRPGAMKLHTFDKRDKAVLYRGEIRKGQWNKFSFDIKSESGKKYTGGVIKVSMNGKSLVSYQGPWAFSPKSYDVGNQLGVDLGIYRTPDTTGKQVVYFDDISIYR